ncbi:MAG: kelch repeat-containing protein [Granulosicoccus sp.]
MKNFIAFAYVLLRSQASSRLAPASIRRLGGIHMLALITCLPGIVVPASADAGSSGAATLVSSVNELEFGQVALGYVGVHQLVLTNAAMNGETITLHSAYLNETTALRFSTDFVGPVALSPGESYSIDVRYSPRRVERALGALFVSHSGSDILDIFALSGRSDGETTMTTRVRRGATSIVHQQQGDLLVIEAEHHASQAAGGSHRWVVSGVNGSSGGVSVVTTPDKGTLRRDSSGSPRMSYQANFTQTGQYTVWVRGLGDTDTRGEGKSDSIHVGIDGNLSTAAAMDQFPAHWTWSRNKRGRGYATITVSSVGKHWIDVWMREDGLTVDKLILTKSASYIPTGTGPSELHADGVGSSGSDDGSSGSSGGADNESGDSDTGSSNADSGSSDDANADNGGANTNSSNTGGSTDAGNNTGSNTNTGENSGDAADSSPELYLQENGILAIEAEGFLTNTPAGPYRWVRASKPGASGGVSMVSTPDKGGLSAGTSDSPRMSYRVKFTTSGQHTVWVRGSGDTNSRGEGKSDSVHVGLNGVLSTAAAMDRFPNSWTWSRSKRGRGFASLNVPRPGVYTIDIWMREDGLIVDKLIIAKDGSFVPGGLGAQVIGGTADTNNGSETGTEMTTGTGGSSDTSGNDREPGNESTGNTTSSAGTLSARTNWAIQRSANGSRPVARHEAGAVELGGKLYLLGGRGSRVTSIYDPASRRWTTGAKPPFEMHHFQPVAVGNKIFIIGAMTCCFPVEKNVANIWTYTPSSDRWNKGPAIPKNRLRGSMAAAVHSGKIYLLGGNTRGHSGGAVSWFDVYDPSTKKWRVLPSARTKRDHMDVAISNGKLIAAGGRQSSIPDVMANTVAAVEVYNFATGKWSNGRAIPTKRAGTMAVSVGDEVIIIGGESTSSRQAHNTVEAYNVITNQWRRLKPLKQRRHSGGSVVMAGRIHVVSGNTRRGGGAETTSHETLAINE